MMGRIMENLRDNSSYVGDFENYLGGFPKTLGLFWRILERVYPKKGGISVDICRWCAANNYCTY